MNRPALPVGHNAARRLDQGDGRLNVIVVQSRFDHQIDLPGRQKRIGIAIHPVAHQFGMARNGLETRPVTGLSDFWKGGENDGVRQALSCAGADGPGPVRTGEVGRFGRACKALSDVGLINHTQNRPAVRAHCDQNTPGRRARHEAARAVNRIEHPCQPGPARGQAKFLAQNGVIGATFGQNGAHRLFGGAICLRDRIKTRGQLVVRHQLRAAKIRQDRGAGGVCHLVCHVTQVIYVITHKHRVPEVGTRHKPSA